MILIFQKIISPNGVLYDVLVPDQGHLVYKCRMKTRVFTADN